jgi:tRNA(fMet)-specific endonuclease VapC
MKPLCVLRKGSFPCPWSWNDLFALRSTNPAANRAKVDGFVSPYLSLPFDDAAASVHAQIRHHLETTGTPIGPYDLQIAAIALVHGSTLVTHNTKEFSRVPGLLFEDWEVP